MVGMVVVMVVVAVLEVEADFKDGFVTIEYILSNIMMQDSDSWIVIVTV